MSKCKHEYPTTEASGFFDVKHGRRFTRTVRCTKCSMWLKIDLDSGTVKETGDYASATINK